MARVIVPFLRFRPSTSTDVVKHRVRSAADYDVSGVDISAAASTDGYIRVPVTDIPFLAGVEGEVEVFITAVDAAGNESDFLRVAGPLDLSAPSAPTDGSIVSGE